MALSKSEQQHGREQAAQASHDKFEAPPSKKKHILVFSVALVVILIGGMVGYSLVQAAKPGPVDEFAQCLSDKGLEMYGADWCKFTQMQRGMFGNSFKYVDYRDFTENDDVKITPTWYINGEKYEKTQSLERLSALSGCELP